MTPFPFSTAIITGAASGIGRALCQQLAASGSKVQATDIDPDALERTTSDIRQSGGSIEATVLDVGDRSAVERFAKETIERWGAPDLLVNNAGIALSGRTWEMTARDLESIMRVNYWGVVHGVLSFLPAMKARDQGRIVNISSIFGIVGCPSMGAYNSSKFAVRGFTECLRMELDLVGSGVRATCVHPGGIDTNIVETQRLASLRDTTPDHEAVKAEFRRRALTSPETAARKILGAAAKGRRRVLVGLDAHLLDLVQRVFPTLYQPLLLRALGRTVDLL